MMQENAMNIKQLLAKKPSARMQMEITPKALEMWNPAIMASSDSGNTINILDQIGEDWYGDGVTATSVSRQLSNFNNEDITVNINSPGGDVFEGIAIYSLLKEYQGNVTVKILGLAASAASIIAMAGDNIKIARAGFFMIHNAWTFAMGNRHELREVSDFLEPIDSALADVYHVEAGIEMIKIESMMDAESWIGGAAAVEQGFADEFLSSNESVENSNKKDVAAIRKLDIALAKACIPRAERRKMLNEFKTSMQDAAGGGMQNATENEETIVELNVEPLPRLSFEI